MSKSAKSSSRRTGFRLPNEAPTSGENFDYTTAARYFARLSEEFLQTYFLLGITQIAHYGRYFIMAQCLELSFKASLANRSISITYATHNLECLEKQLVQHGDVEFEEIRPDAMTEELFDQMYRRKIRNFDLQKFRDHQEALEMLVCYKYAPDLKYGIDKHGNNLLAVAPATSIMNRRFLRYISIARGHFPDQGPDGRKVAEFISHLESRFRDGRFRGASALIH